MAKLTKGAVKHDSSWSDAIVGGFAIQFVGVVLSGFFIAGRVAVILPVVFLPVGIGLSRYLLTRKNWSLRGVCAVALLTLVAYSAILNLVEFVIGRQSFFINAGVLPNLLLLVCSILAAYALLQSLQQSKRVSYLG